MGFYARAQEAIDDAVAAFNQGFEPPLTAYGTSCSAELARLTAGYISLKNGITVTASGFYGPQGRNLGRIAPAYPDLLHRLTSFRWDGYAVANLEMETAGILALSRALGHEAGSLSVALANRREGTFSQDVPAAVTHLIDTGLALMADWARATQ
jgi:uridine phosphorylase